MKALLMLAGVTGMLAAAPAIAQQADSTVPTTSNWIEIENESLVIADWQITVDQAEDLHVNLEDGTRVGQVEEVIGVDASSPEALVVELDNFNGLDDVDVIFPIADLGVAQGSLFTELDAEQIAQLPRWTR